MSDENTNESPDLNVVLADFQQKCNDFMEKVQPAFEEVFGEDHAHLVIGVQTEEVGKATEANPDFPTCALLTNLSVHAVGLAIEDMAYEAERMHDIAHGGDGSRPRVQDVLNDAASEQGFMLTDPASLPEEVREMAQSLADTFGVPVEQIEFRTKVRTDDLTEEALPEWLRGSEVAEAMTGGDIADPALGEAFTVQEVADDLGVDLGANTADAEQAHESGSEQEG